MLTPSLQIIRRLVAVGLSLILLVTVSNCGGGASRSAAGTTADKTESDYAWKKVTDHAAFPEGYNFPLFNFRNQLWVLRSEGNWFSADGHSWTRAELPPLGLRTAYQQYVQFKDAIYALGTMEGDYQNLKVGSRIMKTSNDLKRWEQVAATSELPARVFYGATVFAGKIWLMGGFDGKNYFNDVWSSSDAVKWQRVTEKTPWTPRSNPSVFVFQDRIWLLAGGIIDGPISEEVWSTTDGINWKRENEEMASRPVFGGSVVIYDDKIWMVGLNRNNEFLSAVMVSDDGVNWREKSAPWSPRGGVATCVFGDKLFMTGGKYSITENGQIKFIYSNDVWYLSRAKPTTSN